MNDSLISGLKVTESVSTLFQVKALDSYLDFDLIKVLFLFLSLLDRLYCTLSKLAKVCYYLPDCTRSVFVFNDTRTQELDHWKTEPGKALLSTAQETVQNGSCLF